MAGPAQLESVWKHRDFSIRKTSLESEATLSAKKLGYGVIYSPKIGVTRLTFPKAVMPPITLDQTKQGLMYLRNPADITGIRNESKRPVDLFQVELKYGPRLKRSFLEDDDKIAAATMYLLNGRWPEAFKASVRTDLNAIGSLARSLATHSEPLPADIQRARRAKQDLEFKLSWFGAASRRVRRPGGSGQLNAARGRAPSGGGTGGGSGGGSGGGGGWFGGGGAPPFDPMVDVTVNTKDAKGATPVQGYVIWYNSFGNEDDLSGAEEFSEVSTPTTESIPVGKYTMWAEKESQKSKMRIINVGRPYKTSQIVDLIVP
jgi:hypothetical protein